MQIVGIDMETWYTDSYSLSRIPTCQYVRDERFRCLGCGFQDGLNGHPWYEEDPRETFERLPWGQVAAVAHNAQFDGCVLWERFGRKAPALWLDTQLMARYFIAQGRLPPEQGVSLAKLAPLVGMQKGDTRAAVDAGGSQLAEYGTEDVRIMMALLRRFLGWGVPREELAYMDLHIRMATEPVIDIDRDLLTEAATVTPERERLHKLLRKDANMVALLRRHGVEVETKVTPKGQRKPALAKTDAFMQRLLERDDEVAELASLRLGANSSITRTRAQRMLDVGAPLPVPLLYYGAHTGRASGADRMNPQNLPSRGPLRKAIQAPPGHSFVVVDSRQVEARTVGWLAGDENLLATFRTSDPYRTFGGRFMYHCAPEALTDDQRKIAKAGVLGLGFGQGATGFRRGAQMKSGLDVPEATAELAVQAYRRGFWRVPAWWKAHFAQAQQTGEAVLPSGRKLTYPDMERGVDDEGRRALYFHRHLIFSKGPRGKRQRVKLWHGTTAENSVQASARDVVFWQVWQAAQEKIGQLVWMTHDEAVFCVADDAAEEARERLLWWFSQTPEWAEGLPVEGEAAVAKRYGDAK